MIIRRLACKLLIPVLALAALLPGAVSAAPAHLALLRADPPDGAALAESPRQARLWLNQTVALRDGDVALVDAAGRSIAVAGARAEAYLPPAAGLGDQFDSQYLLVCSVSPSHRPTLLVVDLPELTAGTYRLVWRATIVEGQGVAGDSLVFRVDPASASQVRAASQPASAQRAGDLLVALAVRPNLPGQNFLDLTVTNTRRPAPAPIDTLTVQLQVPGEASGVPLVAESLGDGRYQVLGGYMKSPGNAQFVVTISRAGMRDVTAIIPWTVGPPGPSAAQALFVGRRPLLPPIVLSAAGLALAGAAAIAWRRAKLTRLARSNAIPAEKGNQ